MLSLGFFSVVVLAPPASAAQQTLSIDCNTSPSTVRVTLTVGDTLLTTQTNCTGFGYGGGPGIWSYGPNGTENLLGVGSPNPASIASGDKVLFRSVLPSVPLAIPGTEFTDGPASVRVIITVLDGPGSSEGSEGPAPVMQQFGRPASGTCDAAAPDTLNWSNVPSGGWSESWAQWMNGGNGGDVCTRTLVYSTSQSRWIVG